MARGPEPEFLVPPEAAPLVFLSEPDEEWAAQYAVEEILIRAALGPVLQTVDHVGSTAVPGLPAKPVLDILLTVEDPALESAYVAPLEAAGYTLHHREPHWHEHRLFKKGTPHFSEDRPTDQPRVNLHVFRHGCEEVRRMLAFRDWLIDHEDDRLLYAETKRRLAQESWDRVQDYADAKTDVIAEIMERAVHRRDTSRQPSNRVEPSAPTGATSG